MFIPWVKEVVEKFDDLVCPERYRAYTDACESLLHHADALFKLAAVLHKAFVVCRLVNLSATEKRAKATLNINASRAVGYDDKETFCHDIDFGSEGADELNVFTELDTHKVVVLTRFFRMK